MHNQLNLKINDDLIKEDLAVIGPIINLSASYPTTSNYKRQSNSSSQTSGDQYSRSFNSASEHLNQVNNKNKNNNSNMKSSPQKTTKSSIKMAMINNISPYKSISNSNSISIESQQANLGKNSYYQDDDYHEVVKSIAKTERTAKIATKKAAAAAAGQ